MNKKYFYLKNIWMAGDQWYISKYINVCCKQKNG